MENTEQETVQSVSPQIVYEQDKAAIDVQISTAKAYPRNITKATTNAVAIATLDFESADRCNYALKRGDKIITGPSVHLAKILAQCWGNMRIDAKVVSIDDRQITSEAVCFDLENNLAIKTQIKRSIMQHEWINGKRSGRMIRMNDDMITVIGNASNSIAMRNAILSVIPRGVVDKAYNAVKRLIAGELNDKDKLTAATKKTFDYFKDTYGVTEKEVLDAIKKAAVEHITPDDIVILRGFETAIKGGDSSFESIFRPKKTPPAEIEIIVEQLQILMDEKVAFLNKPEFDSAKRIIEMKETDSYRKLFDLLTSKTE